MALLSNIAIGDDEDAREFAREDDAEIYGVCPSCGFEHGAGFCVEDGDHVVCGRCGVLHERDYCAASDGVVL